ncbi:fatty acid synthase alpha subunit Lsd1 [Linderina pennispora]|nr:fatty acid synthase alpha subunit Lsd1 [Linderina pennispora]
MGWIRDAGQNNLDGMVACEIERSGVRTFSPKEMSLNILTLLHEDIDDIVQDHPVYADFTGPGEQYFASVRNLGITRQNILQASSCRKSVLSGLTEDQSSLYSEHTFPYNKHEATVPLANHSVNLMPAKTYAELEHLRHLQGMVNLDKVVVIAGYGEFGPYGHSRSRWEMEAYGEFSLEGCIELAWIMGFIKHHNGPLPLSNENYTGWVDTVTDEPIRDIDVKAKYEKLILEHTGIRMVEPELVDGFDANKKLIYRELQITHDLETLETTAEEAENFVRENGDKVDTWENPDGSWSVKLLKGAVIMVPKALQMNTVVAGQLPTGWSPERYGIPQEIIEQVDPMALCTLIATVEALVRAGITDPYELYKYFHVTEVGTTVGSGMGGTDALRRMTKGCLHDAEIPADLVKEMFINSPGAWVNMLLLSSSGPIMPIVAACGTSHVSVDVAISTIKAGKARIMFAGGFEDTGEGTNYAFAPMGATVDNIEDRARGRTLKEASRPCTTTRNGFVESTGAGVVMLMSASAAIEFGSPIYGVVAMTSIASDKEGRNLPAPGQGLVSVAREIHCPSYDITELYLDVKYRRAKLEGWMKHVDEWVVKEEAEVRRDAQEIRIARGDCFDEDEFIGKRMTVIHAEADKRKKEARDAWGNEFWVGNPHISPIRGALAVWGLTVDDIGVASFHGTSTQINDKNESEIYCKQMEHLGRTPGHALPVICQKWIIGHVRGGSAAFMMSGVLQTMQTGIIPGNRNADDIDPEFRQHKYLVYPNRSIQTRGVKAAIMSSFGFGQVGCQMLVVHPDYLLATLGKDQLDEYNGRVKLREGKSCRYWQDTLIGSHGFVQAKDSPPYTDDQESTVLLNPLARASYDPVSKSYQF